MFDFEAFEFQIAPHDVGSDCRAEVAEVTVIPDRWATIVETNFALAQRLKLFDLARECVAKSKHAAHLLEIRALGDSRTRMFGSLGKD